MKKFQLLNWILFAFVALQFSACQDQTSIGIFPEEDGPAVIGDGEFIAIVNDAEFISDSISAIISLDNVLVLAGIKTNTGERIILTLENPSEGLFDITSGLGNQNIGIYKGVNNPLNPYTTLVDLGGSGELEITEFNADLMTVSGTFNMRVVRSSLDSNGNPITESIDVKSGEFSKIPFSYEDEASIPHENYFFAIVDGIDFIPELNPETRLDTIGGIIMVRVEAVNAVGAKIRIDIPEDLGIGTFEMKSLSNGTNLIGLYNSNTGEENLTSNPGVLEITEFDTVLGKIEATFYFTARDPLGENPAVSEITEGAFAIGYKNPINTLIAEVDGVSFSADSISIAESNFNEFAIYIVTAIETDTNQKIELFFPVEFEVGTLYEMSASLITGNEVVGEYTPDIGNSILYSSNPGNFVILEYNMEEGIIDGTFSFLAKDNVGDDPELYEISNGEFSLLIQ